MMLMFNDFVTAIKKRGLLTHEYESLLECLLKANKWIEREKPDIVNVETIIESKTLSGFPRCQRVRIWYKVYKEQT